MRNVRLEGFQVPPLQDLADPRQVDVAGVSTRYYDMGSGSETVVFVCGGNFGSTESATSAYSWNLNAGALAQTNRVILFDKLGQGYTHAPLRDEDYTMGAVVRHICGLLDVLGLKSVHLVGHSRGGFAATRVALERPDLIKTLTIVSSGTLSPGVGTNEVVLAAPPYPSPSREAARWVYENCCFKPQSVTEEWIDAVMDVLRQPSYLEGVDKLIRQQLGLRLFQPDLERMKRETLSWLGEGRLQRPTQIIWGFNDRTAVHERGLQLFNMLSAHERRVTFNLLNEAGHYPFRERPERFNALLSAFVAQYKS